MNRLSAPLLTFSAFVLFWLTVSQQNPNALQRQEGPANIIIPSPIQVLLYGGDRFLAANIEEIRAAAAATSQNAQAYRVRAHSVISELNPCHEDNYWIGNASLSWGGAEEEGFELLANAMHCRYWDEWPAFFYGFNQHFFRNNVSEARQALEIAAQRSTANATTFRNFSIMLAAGEIDDTRAALKMLQREHDEAKDPKLREMLEKRVVRLNGLLTLRDAQAAFESLYGKPLTHPKELLENSLLDAYPDDPLQLGYEFRDHTFHLRQMKIQE